jgi:hypothetical protein
MPNIKKKDREKKLIAYKYIRNVQDTQRLLDPFKE